MDNKKKQEFVTKMSLKKNQKFSKGGVVKRKKFALGGPTSLTNTSSTNTGGPLGLGNLLGTSNQYQAQGAPIQVGTNQDQLNAAYNTTQNALGQQQGLVNAVQPGVTQGAATQNALTGQLQGVIAGTGPNAAQTALNQNTAQNVANQAALMAGQRGAGANTGLIARQAAQQGAATQQQAVGQAATLQAQQAIAAQQQLAGLASTQVGQGQAAVQGLNNAQQNEQNILQGANTAANNANVSMMSNINTTNAGVAQGNQANNQGILGGISNMLSNVPVIGSLFNEGGEVTHTLHMADGGQIMARPLDVAATTPATVGVGQWLNSNVQTQGPNVSTTPAAPMAVPKYGTNAKDKKQPASSDASSSALTDAYDAYGGMGGNPITIAGEAGDMGGVGAAGELGSLGDLAILASKGGKICSGFVNHKSHVANYLASGGNVGDKVPAMVSPGEIYLNPEQVHAVIHEGKNPLKIGKKFGGNPKVKGDSPKNDTIPTDLQEGGVVIPRHVVTKMNPEKAKAFVAHSVAKKAVKHE